MCFWGDSRSDLGLHPIADRTCKTHGLPSPKKKNFKVPRIIKFSHFFPLSLQKASFSLIFHKNPPWRWTPWGRTLSIISSHYWFLSQRWCCMMRMNLFLITAALPFRGRAMLRHKTWEALSFQLLANLTQCHPWNLRPTKKSLLLSRSSTITSIFMRFILYWSHISLVLLFIRDNPMP